MVFWVRTLQMLYSNSKRTRCVRINYDHKALLNAYTLMWSAIIQDFNLFLESWFKFIIEKC